MPIYEFICPNGHHFERYVPLDRLDVIQLCACGSASMRQISPPLAVSVQQECRYRSPVTGEPVTNWQQRRNDLAKHDCIPYDPEMKTDATRRLRDGEAATEKAVEETVEATIAKMPTSKRQQLYNEITRQGVDAEYHRSTPC